MRLPPTVSRWGLASFGAGVLWFLCQSVLNGWLVMSYVENGQIGMMWIVVILYGFPTLCFIGVPAMTVGMLAVSDGRGRKLPTADRVLRWTGLLLALTGPAEALVLFLRFLPSMF